MQTQTNEVPGLVVPDFSDVKDAVEAGIYKVQIIDAKLDSWQGKNGKPDTQYINWTLETFDEENPKNNGRRIWHKTPTMGGGAFRLQEFWKAATGVSIPAEGFDPSSVFGNQLEVTVIDGTDKQGNFTGYTEVKTVKPIA